MMEEEYMPSGCTPKCEKFHYQNSENCLCGTSDELASECQIGVCINYNDPEGCGCASVESDQQGYNNSDCLEDKSFSQLSECNEESGIKVEEGSCKCTNDYAPEGCKCARDDELVRRYDISSKTRQFASIIERHPLVYCTMGLSPH
ncbi:MAG: hypothetical protein EZS28_024970 [Streblomastix strix]|uniref:Uncharacterized protein n=1 Tax=Streblomastix strix TaxID=222440 RepID=A0A5J4VAH3_9EUKA|nr:MAG: hypothetical protein EZS28_024970 [Streblomastix strix]